MNLFLTCLWRISTYVLSLSRIPVGRIMPPWPEYRWPPSPTQLAGLSDKRETCYNVSAETLYYTGVHASSADCWNGSGRPGELSPGAAVQLNDGCYGDGHPSKEAPNLGVRFHLLDNGCCCQGTGNYTQQRIGLQWDIKLLIYTA